MDHLVTCRNWSVEVGSSLDGIKLMLSSSSFST